MNRRLNGMDAKLVNDRRAGIVGVVWWSDAGGDVTLALWNESGIRNL